MNSQQKAAIRKMQATLTKISLGEKCFFNIVNLRDKQEVIKEHKGKWCLTSKGQMMMNAVI